MPRLTPPTSTVEEEQEAEEAEEAVEAAVEIMTASEDREATSASHATSGESTALSRRCVHVRVNTEGHPCPSP